LDFVKKFADDKKNKENATLEEYHKKMQSNFSEK
jgi:hypothetical protein